MTSPRDLLRSLFDAAVAAADPAICVPAHLPVRPQERSRERSLGRVVVVGAGKASAAMAAAVEQAWGAPLEGLIVTRYGHAVPTRWIEVAEASHPVPDAAGTAAAEQILQRVGGLTADDLVLCLISGGGSALLALPAPGLSLADKQAVTTALLRSGANISEMNAVRKHLSAIKGGRLAAAAHPAKLITLMISDVPGDDPATIASGPTVPDPTTFADARTILAKYGIREPAAVIAHLDRAEAESPKPGDPRLAGAVATIVASPAMSLAAAADRARAAGYEVDLLGDALEGEARELGRAHAGLALKAASAGRRVAILSGGETTVTLRGRGRGGRNSEYLLGLTLGLDGAAGIHALAADTDGIDGSEDNAGAFAAPDSLARARRLGIDPAARLAENDAYGVFAALGDLLVTGPTRTNVNDFRAILVGS